MKKFGNDTVAHAATDPAAVDAARVRSKADSAFQSLSSFYLHALLPHWSGNRDALYAVIQKASFESKDAADFHARLSKESGLTLPKDVSLDAVYLKAVDETFKRVDKAYPLPT